MMKLGSLLLVFCVLLQCQFGEATDTETVGDYDAPVGSLVAFNFISEGTFVHTGTFIDYDPSSGDRLQIRSVEFESQFSYSPVLKLLVLSKKPDSSQFHLFRTIPLTDSSGGTASVRHKFSHIFETPLAITDFALPVAHEPRVYFGIRVVAPTVTGTGSNFNFYSDPSKPSFSISTVAADGATFNAVALPTVNHMPIKVTYSRMPAPSQCSLNNFCNMWSVLQFADRTSNTNRGNCPIFLPAGFSCSVACDNGAVPTGAPHVCSTTAAVDYDQQTCAT